jgi:methylated-DNA-[protein]-cysteine S-methyltransferase
MKSNNRSIRNKIKTAYFKTPFGELILGDYNNALCLCDWRYRKMRDSIDARLERQLESQFVEEKSSLIQEARLQLDQYFKGDRKEFDLPLLLSGTAFQKNVWNALLHIPYGKTLSYSKLSAVLGDKKAIRAVASANGANVLAIIVPCHRIIGSEGSMIGYAGGMEVKKKLLKLEKALPANQLDLF